MTEFLTIFAAQLLYIGLLGLQSLNVNNARYAAAAFTSLFLGVCGVYLVQVAAHANDGPWTNYVAYISAGPCGICLSMWIFGRGRRGDN